MRVVRPHGGRGYGGKSIYFLLLSLCLCACPAEPPEVDPIPSETPDAGSGGYVDFIVSYDEAGSTVTCTADTTAICTVQTGPCADHPVLGAPDGRSFELASGSQIEVGFFCQPIVDRAPNSDLSPDFRVVGTFAGTGSAVISVSEDGSEYTILAPLFSDNQEFDLANERLEFVRFVRIANQGTATLSLDAIEVL